MVLQLRRVHPVLGVVGGVLVQVRHEDGLAVRGLDVFSRAAIAVATGADFEVEGAVDLVELGAEDGGEEIGHCGLLLWNGEKCDEAVMMYDFFFFWRMISIGRFALMGGFGKNQYDLGAMRAPQSWARLSHVCG